MLGFYRGHAFERTTRLKTREVWINITISTGTPCIGRRCAVAATAKQLGSGSAGESALRDLKTLGVDQRSLTGRG